MTETWTVLRLLNWCRDYFKGKGIETARLDAECLLAHALSIDRLGLYLRYDQPLNGDELTAVRELVKRRAQREPVAYLIGHREFYGLSFQVDRRVLVPRPDTELLVEKTLAMLPTDRPQEICEVGAGSGCVAISLAVRASSWRVVAVDCSTEALALAADNAAVHAVNDRVRLVAGDLFAELTGPFDAVVSNPPYIPTREIAQTMPEVARFEPAVALDGGEDGLRFICRLVTAAPRLLRPGGRLLLECGSGQAEIVQQYLRDNGQYLQIQVYRDLAGIERVISAARR